eukprot:UN33498
MGCMTPREKTSTSADPNDNDPNENAGQTQDMRHKTPTHHLEPTDTGRSYTDATASRPLIDNQTSNRSDATTLSAPRTPFHVVSPRLGIMKFDAEKLRELESDKAKESEFLDAMVAIHNVQMAQYEKTYGKEKADFYRTIVSSDSYYSSMEWDPLSDDLETNYKWRWKLNKLYWKNKIPFISKRLSIRVPLLTHLNHLQLGKEECWMRRLKE